ncbi:MAG: hypothetical protein FRX48_03230 [Lasallia pustulata]|uniref:RNA polymerase II transcription factor SIII, subunit A n=1 Tax=Lasallia pustulata TaxID=136370 RepID=A0A5M8PWP7_9LECA|nr:MAG: hypothetical protein FRX48_03230 [Lasallia pustulata]
MPALPLYHLARKACVKNIRSITDVGDIPYELVRPILIKLENPEQLRELEKSSPQLCGADAEIWREFIKRDIPRWEDKPHEPWNPQNWYKVYRKLRMESQQEVEKDAEILRAAMEGIQSERAKHTSKVVDSNTVPRLPRMGGMRVEGGRSRTTNAKSGNSALLTFGSGSRTKMVTGKDVLEKARREAREMSLFSAKKSILAVPTHKLQGKATQVRTAPHGLLEEHKKPPQPNYVYSTTKPTTIFAPKKRTAENNPTVPGGMTAEERESRLKAFTAPNSNTKPLSPPTSRPQNMSTMSPPPWMSSPAHPNTAYMMPRMKPQSAPEGKGSRPPGKTKAPVDPFMPAKRRKVA